MKNVYVCGFNGFKQFINVESTRIASPTKISLLQLFCKAIYAISWSFNAIAYGNKVELSGFLIGVAGNRKLLEFGCPIKQLAVNDSRCLALLENGDIIKISIETLIIDKLRFLDIEQNSNKRNIFGDLKQTPPDEVEWLVAGNVICVAITRNNFVYNIPVKIHQFPKYIRIVSVKCGAEHALALTSNGDIYSWGNGLRGQLGNEVTEKQEIPLIVEPLAGIKIVRIASGSWSSAAVCSFGTLYVWGFNNNGQLGLKCIENIPSPLGQIVEHRKKQSVYYSPEIVDLPSCCCFDGESTEACSIKEVFCGARHTFVQKSCGKLYNAGWNSYGQLGINSSAEFQDEFVEFKNLTNIQDIICGPWCTVFVTDEI